MYIFTRKLAQWLICKRHLKKKNNPVETVCEESVIYKAEVLAWWVFSHVEVNPKSLLLLADGF